eukprot:TRINITY_DN31395_c0_g1_i1.p1 TRINITY_DN31395_c0_g1~~TRINITY_DN31395_c0_g1_i1.p1  ORF type:complete len:289 (+),score=39.50 TRINITY_DN31395_c0_g1_i1:38-904(+)
MAAVFKRVATPVREIETLVRKLKWGRLSGGRLVARNASSCVEVAKIVRAIETMKGMGMMKAQLIESVIPKNHLSILPITKPPYFILSLTKEVVILVDDTHFKVGGDTLLRVDSDTRPQIIIDPDHNTDEDGFLLLQLSPSRRLLKERPVWEKAEFAPINIHLNPIQRRYPRSSASLADKLSSIDDGVLLWCIRSHLRLAVTSVMLGWPQTGQYLQTIATLTLQFTEKRHLRELLPLLQAVADRGLLHFDLFTAFVQKARELDFTVVDLKDSNVPLQIKKNLPVAATSQ